MFKWVSLMILACTMAACGGSKKPADNAEGATTEATAAPADTAAPAVDTAAPEAAGTAAADVPPAP